MKKNSILLLVLAFALHIFGEVNDTFSHNGIQYQVTKEDLAAQSFEVSAVYYDSACIILPDSITNGIHTYAVTDAIQWYNPQNCALRHYRKIDMSAATHITTLSSQRSGLIAIDTLILPPNLERFPSWCHTTDSLTWRTQLMDEEQLLPGIHRIWSTGTQQLEDIKLKYCTSLIEADLSSYTSTFNNRNMSYIERFSCNPFLERLVIPNTITTFSDGIFSLDKRLMDVNIPDSLESIYGFMTEEMPMDTLRLGKKVSYIFFGFAGGWHELKHIDVDSANSHFMDDDGVLYNKNQSVLCHYPYMRNGSEYHMSSKTDSIWREAFSYGWPADDITSSGDYVWHIKALADKAPLKKLVCSTVLTYLGDAETFMGSGIRSILKFGENRVKVIPMLCFMYAAIDSIALPYHLTEIGYMAFAYTYNLHVINNLSSLKQLEHIGEGAFRDAWKLEKIDLLPCDQLKEIPPMMCLNDSALQSISMPRNVQSIGDQAFKNCGALQQIICPALVPISIDPSVFEGVDKQNCVLKVPARSLSLYQNAPVWQDFFHMDTDGFYYIETAVSDSFAGYVTGGGAYMRGEKVTLSAEANEGYRFVSWSDGHQYDTRIVTVMQDESFTAIFEPIPVHSLTVVANDDTMGSVTGSGEYEEGEEVTLIAVPNEGYCLLSWDFTNDIKDTIIYTIPDSDVTLTAYFAPCDELIESVEYTYPGLKKLHNGQLFIIREDNTFTIIGQEVK